MSSPDQAQQAVGGEVVEARPPWYRAIGPALITACVVFGPGSLLISSKVGATYSYELLWLLILSGVLMGAYMTMSARIGVVGGGTVCQLVSDRLGRPLAVILGINLFLICSAFQFSNNIAVAAAADAMGVAALFGDPSAMSEHQLNWINSGVLIVFNAFIIGLVFSLRQVYRVLERGMKVMVALILVCFVINLLVVRPFRRRSKAGYARLQSASVHQLAVIIGLECPLDAQRNATPRLASRLCVDQQAVERINHLGLLVRGQHGADGRHGDR